MRLPPVSNNQEHYEGSIMISTRRVSDEMVNLSLWYQHLAVRSLSESLEILLMAGDVEEDLERETIQMDKIWS